MCAGSTTKYVIQLNTKCAISSSVRSNRVSKSCSMAYIFNILFKIYMLYIYIYIYIYIGQIDRQIYTYCLEIICPLVHLHLDLSLGYFHCDDDCIKKIHEYIKKKCIYNTYIYIYIYYIYYIFIYILYILYIYTYKVISSLQFDQI